MNRRQFLTVAAWSPVVWVLGTKFVATLRPYPLTELLRQLRALPPDKLVSTGQWSVTEILQHCSQSIRYSIEGYPQLYSPWFQNTVGKLALNFFAAKGSMHHPLAQPIPGAPALVASLPNDLALRALMNDIQHFIAWQGKLQPHFAYGTLTKAQYYSVHYLHLSQHLTEIQQQS